MALRIVHVWEGHQVNCDMANNALFVKSFSNCVSDLQKVNAGQRSLGEETARVDKFAARESIERANQVDMATWLDVKSHRWRLERDDLAKRRCRFNNATTFAEVL